MHTCNTCGKSFKIISKLNEHHSRQAPCRPATHFCSSCNREFSSYHSLWRHRKNCQGNTSHHEEPSSVVSSIGQKRPMSKDIQIFDGAEFSGAKPKSRNVEREIPTFDGSEFGTGKPKSKETMDKLRRHVLDDEAVEVEPPTKTARMSSTTELDHQHSINQRVEL